MYVSGGMKSQHFFKKKRLTLNYLKEEEFRLSDERLALVSLEWRDEAVDRNVVILAVYAPVLAVTQHGQREAVSIPVGFDIVIGN